MPVAFRFVYRSLHRHPGYAAAAILVLGLATGIALSTIMLVDALLLRPLPLVDLQHVFTLHRHHRDLGSSDGFTYHEYDHIAQNATEILETVSGAGSDSLYVTVDAAGQLTPVYFVTDLFFDIIGVRPVDGRGFAESDYEVGASPVAVVTHAFWRSALAGDRAAIGQTVSVGTGTATIVGILPQGFRGLSVSEPVDVYLPIPTVVMLSPSVEVLVGSAGNSPTSWIRITVRLKAGASARSAGTYFTAIMNRASRQESRGEETIVAVPLARAALPPETRSDTLRFIAMLVIACITLLFAGCANVAGMMMVRNEQRHEEIATRICLGASRGSILQLWILEILALTSIGAVVGLYVALLLLRMAERFVALPGEVAIADLATGWTGYEMVFGVTATAVTAAAVCAAVGRLQMVKAERTVKSPPFISRYGRILAGQVAVVAVLMVGAGLFVKSAKTAATVDGVNRDGLFYMTISLRDYNEGDAKTNLYRAIGERVNRVPGIVGQTFGSLPLVGPSLSVSEIAINGERRRVPAINVFACGPDYLQTVGLSLVAGRDFEPGNESVAIISESLARNLWGDEQPIGRRFTFTPLSGEVAVIGVVRNGRYGGLRDTNGFAVFLPWKEGQIPAVTGTVIGRAARGTAVVLPVVQREIQAVDADLQILAASTYEERIGRLTQQQRVAAALLIVIGGVSLLIAGLGVFSSVAYVVANRSREIAIRIALGANLMRVMMVAVSETLAHVIMGIGIGMCAAVIFAKVVEPYLLDVSPYDAATYATVAAAVIGVTVCASVIPTVRAVRADSISELLRS